jgi:putative transcriptional regulator
MLLLAVPSAPRLDTDLRQVRLARRYSQERLAREVGVSRQTIVNIENGMTIPNVLLALSIAAVLVVAVEKLFRPGGLGSA